LSEVKRLVDRVFSSRQSCQQDHNRLAARAPRRRRRVSDMTDWRHPWGRSSARPVQVADEPPDRQSAALVFSTNPDRAPPKLWRWGRQRCGEGDSRGVVRLGSAAARRAEPAAHGANLTPRPVAVVCRGRKQRGGWPRPEYGLWAAGKRLGKSEYASANRAVSPAACGRPSSAACAAVPAGLEGWWMSEPAVVADLRCCRRLSCSGISLLPVSVGYRVRTLWGTLMVHAETR